jgi:hypothetical protein
MVRIRAKASTDAFVGGHGGGTFQPVRLAGGWWLVLVCSERRVLLAGCWWLVCCERKVLLAGG